MIRTVARRLLGRIARRTARDELFEKPGERAPTAPLRAPASGAKSSEDEDEDEDDDDEEVLVQPGGAAAVERLAGPVVLHHWATWCESCLDELPRVERLHARTGRVHGVSWELFDAPGPPEAATRRVAGFCAEQGLSWPSTLWTEGPEALFTHQDMRYQKIPQTRVLSSDGEVLHEVRGPLDDAAIEVLAALVGDPE